MKKGGEGEARGAKLYLTLNFGGVANDPKPDDFLSQQKTVCPLNLLKVNPLT